MGRFMTHDSIAGGLFNSHHSTGVGQFSHWESECRNTPEILELLVRRMHDDYAQLHIKMRRAYSMKDLDFWLDNAAAICN